MPDQEQPSRQGEPRAGRPHMPAGYGIHPLEAGGLLSWSTVTDQLVKAHNYWVITTSQGQPHAAPVWGVWLDDTVYFSTDRASRKSRNLAANPEIVVHLESGDDVVILEGTAEEITDPELLQRFADGYEAKYQFRPSTDGSSPIYGLRPRVVHAWLEKDFARTATSWRFDRDD